MLLARKWLSTTYTDLLYLHLAGRTLTVCLTDLAEP